MTLATDFIKSSEVKRRSERRKRFDFNSGEVAECSECNQRFHFNRSKVK